MENSDDQLEGSVAHQGGGAIALMAAAAIALAACSGGGGLNEDEAAGLQQELEEAQTQAAAALVAQQAAEAAEKAAQAEKATAETEKTAAETAKAAAEIAKAAADDARDAAVAVAQDAQKAAEAAAASAKQAAAALVEAKAAEEEAKADQKAAEDAAAEADRLRRLAVAATEVAEQQSEDSDEARDRAEQMAEDAQQLANRAEAKDALEGLGGLGADAAVAGMIDDDDVTPRYRTTTLVNAVPTDGTQAVTFKSERRSSSGRWSITTLSNAGSTHNDELVVYSDIKAPTRVPIQEEYIRFEDVPDTNLVRDEITSDDAALIASSRFPSGGNPKTFEHTIDSMPDVDGPDDDENTRNEYDTTKFSGTFDGVSGTFECTGTCTITHRGNRYEITSGTWTFTTSKSARVSVGDDSYMYFGSWRRKQLSDESLSFETFADGVHSATGQASAFDSLGGSATYRGPAVGQYAIYQPAGTDSGTDSFTASAELMADFGNNMLSGQVTSFSNASDWSLTLNQVSMEGGDLDNGTVSWTIGSRTEDGGAWAAEFFSEEPYAGQTPDGVAGTFTGQFDEVGRLTGAFGAHCVTSAICP